MISVTPKMLQPTMCQASPNSVTGGGPGFRSATIARTIQPPWVMLFASSLTGGCTEAWVY